MTLAGIYLALAIITALGTYSAVLQARRIYWAVPIYFMAAFVIFTASVYAVVQAMLGETPWSLVVIPIAVVIIVGLHIASLIGQRLSSDQMEVLKARFDETLRIAQVTD